MSHLQVLTDRIRPIDTGLNAAVLLATYDYGCTDAPSIVNLFADMNGYGEGDFNYRKKTQGVRKALRQLEAENLLTIKDLGRQKPGDAQFVIEHVESNHVDSVIEAAYNSINTCSMLDLPLHYFWRVKGGSYSTAQKQVVQGTHLSPFYGLTQPDLDSTSPQVNKPAPLLSSDWADAVNMKPVTFKGYSLKFIEMGLVKAGEKLGIHNEYGVDCNCRLYSLTPTGQTLMEELFFPQLAKTFDSHGLTPSEKPHAQDLTNIIQLHYDGFKNQFSQ